MSKLAELLHSRGLGAATSATSATSGIAANSQAIESSKSSECSKGGEENYLTADLARRLAAMAQRWRYSDAELVEVLELARLDPAKWTAAVSHDEQREEEFRNRGFLPSAQ